MTIPLLPTRAVVNIVFGLGRGLMSAELQEQRQQLQQAAAARPLPPAMSARAPSCESGSRSTCGAGAAAAAAAVAQQQPVESLGERRHIPVDEQRESRRASARSEGSLLPSSSPTTWQMCSCAHNSRSSTLKRRLPCRARRRHDGAQQSVRQLAPQLHAHATPSLPSDLEWRRRRRVPCSSLIRAAPR
jgi:hypothetical protein